MRGVPAAGGLISQRLVWYCSEEKPWLCWVILPQYSLLSVAGVLEPHEVMEEIKRSKTQDEGEEGVAA